MRHDRLAPPQLLDTDGEGIYLRAQEGDGHEWGNTLVQQAARIFGCEWRELDSEAVTFITRDEGETWERIDFKNWRWLWPISHWHQPALFIYYAPKPS